MAQMTRPKTPIEFSTERSAFLDALGTEIRDDQLPELLTAIGDIRRLRSLDIPDVTRVWCRSVSSLRVNHAFESAFMAVAPQLGEVPMSQGVDSVEQFDAVIQARDRIESFYTGFSWCHHLRHWADRDVPNSAHFDRLVNIFDIGLNAQRSRFHLGPNDLRAKFGERSAFSDRADDPQWLMRVCAQG